MIYTSLWKSMKRKYKLEQHVDYLLTPSFFIKMLFLVDDFVVKIHIIFKLYVALPFYIWSTIVVSTSYFKRYVFGTAFCEKEFKAY